MNREIKFRAWCEGKHDNLTFTRPQMDYNVIISAEGNYCSVEGGWDIQGEYKTVPLMQFTGLKDKNGKEIYEGDIVKLPKEDKCSGGCCKYEKDLGCWLSEVVWQCDGFQINNHGANHATEIIGNIYENKDLSKSKTGYAI